MVNQYINLIVEKDKDNDIQELANMLITLLHKIE